jgi:hypothetical protein
MRSGSRYLRRQYHSVSAQDLTELSLGSNSRAASSAQDEYEANHTEINWQFMSQ